MKSQRTWLIIAGALGFIGVALGAFGAHGLKASLTPEMLEIYKTGVQYHLIHAIAILAIALYGKPALFRPAIFFLTGIILFSFSLYLYAVTGVTFLAMITPFGGVSFLIGWAIIIYLAAKNKLSNGS